MQKKCKKKDPKQKRSKTQKYTIQIVGFDSRKRHDAAMVQLMATHQHEWWWKDEHGVTQFSHHRHLE